MTLTYSNYRDARDGCHTAKKRSLPSNEKKKKKKNIQTWHGELNPNGGSATAPTS